MNLVAAQTYEGRVRFITVFIGVLAVAVTLVLPADAAVDRPLLVVLTESGRTRDNVPVLLPHPDAPSIAAKLDTGITRELASVWHMLQTRRNRERGVPIEPAYVLLSGQQGGFPRYGFYLGDVKKAGTPYVDVFRGWELSGRLGAIDQIFPHELAHAIIHELGVEPPPGLRANQVHAVAVRTDRFTAFNEGFAEHIQLMAVEHPGALPETRALPSAYGEEDLAQSLDAYRREMSARFAPATRMRMTFPLWYSNAERNLRYAGVKRNAFAHEVTLAEHLLERGGRARGYLLENTLPGDPAAPRKPLARLLATEGVVSSFFYGWASDGELQQRLRDDAFYAQYGVARDALTPLQNVYLKIFHVLAERKPQSALDLARAYAETFPDEGPLVDAHVLRTFGTHMPDDLPPELWLAGSFETGTTVFDQFRAAPRVHTFDLNAASILDLTTIEGVTPQMARAIAAASPFRTIDDVRGVAGVTPATVATMQAMAKRVGEVEKELKEEELSISSILLPYLWRSLAVLITAAIAGALLYRIARRISQKPSSAWRTIVSGGGIGMLAVPLAWLLGSGLLAAGLLVLLFGVPAALWSQRRDPAAIAILVARAASVVPAVILTTAWF